MDRRRAAAALLALAACIACSTAAPTANNQTALETIDGTVDGCYYNFQHYGEGDRIMTNEPCLNCTCHNRMLMCYLRVCPFTKPIGQDCTVEKRADQCCPIVTCPDVPVDLLTSTSTSSPAEYGSTGIGKYDRYGCSINGKYFSEGSKVPSTPNKPCEHCYCIRNMTTCVMQECTLHVDGCTPIYHKEVCCPVRYSCDHTEDEIPLLDDMTTTERPTPGFILTTTTLAPVTQMTQDCVHDDQIFNDGALIKTEKACEHCYCMKGDIVCVVQECGTPMENEGKNCTSLAPRHGQCCPDTYICEGDDRSTESTTETIDQTTLPPKRTGDEGSGYRNEPDETYTEIIPYVTEIEGSGEDDTTSPAIGTLSNIVTEKVSPDMIDEMLLGTTDGHLSHSSESDQDQNTIPDLVSDKINTDLPIQEHVQIMTEANTESATTSSELKTTVYNEHQIGDDTIFKDENIITTESSFRKEDDNIIPDEIITLKDNERSTTSSDLLDETITKDEHKVDETVTRDDQMIYQTTTIDDYVRDKTTTEDDNLLDKNTDLHLTTQSIDSITEKTNYVAQKEITTENLGTTNTNVADETTKSPVEQTQYTSITTVTTEKSDITETTSANSVTIEDNDSILQPGRIPGEGDCLLNGKTYSNNTLVPSTNNCHTSCKCTSSIIKCDPIICSPPPEYMENMNDCQPIYDSPDACCPTYVCNGKETIPPESHSQMSGTEIPKPITENDCTTENCLLDKGQTPISDQDNSCKSGDCVNKLDEKQDQSHIPQDCSGDKCENSPVVACDGDKCKPIDSDLTTACDERGDCQKPIGIEPEECKDDKCRRKDSAQLDEMKTEIPKKHITSPTERSTDVFTFDVTKQEPFTESSETTTSPQLITEGDVKQDGTAHTESPIMEKIPENEDDSIITEKTEIKTPAVTEDVTLMDQTSSESDILITKSPEIDDNRDMVTETTQTDQKTTIKYSLENETLKPTERETYQETTVTEKIQMNTEPTVETTVSYNGGFGLLNDKSTTTSIEIKSTDTTDKETSDISVIREDSTTSSSLTEAFTTKQTEMYLTDKTSEIVPITNKPLKDDTQEIDENYTKPTENSETQDVSTELVDIIDHTKPPVNKDEKDITGLADLTTKPNKILTDQTTSMPTIPSDDGKEITIEIATENYVHTDPPEYMTTKLDETSDETTKHSTQHTEFLTTTIIKSEISESPITEKHVTSSESSIQISQDKISEESDEPTTERQELITKLYDSITERVTNKESSEIPDSSTVVAIEMYTDKSETTSSDELVSKTYEINKDSSSEVSELQPTTISYLITTENKDMPSENPEKTIGTEETESNEILRTTLKMEELTTVKIIDLSTEKSIITSESTASEETTEKMSSSNKPTISDEKENNKVMTTVKDVNTPEVTTVSNEFTASDKNTETSLDGFTSSSLTEMSTISPLSTDSKDVDEDSKQTPEIEKIFTTPSIQSSPQEIGTTEKYDTVNTIGTLIDLATKSTIVNEMNIETTTVFETDDENIIKTKTTSIPEHKDEEKSTSQFVDSDILSKTTVSMTSIEDKETVALKQTTEKSTNDDLESTNKQVTEVTSYESEFKTTEKSILEENLPITTDKHESDDKSSLSPKVTMATVHDISTEKVHLPSIFETDNPYDIRTTEASLLTETGVEETNIDKNKETTVQYDFTTSTEKYLTKDQTEKSTVPDSTNEDKLLTSSTFIPSTESIFTEASILDITDDSRISNSDTDKKETDESTTKHTYDQTNKEEEKYTIFSDQYTTESQSQNTDISNNNNVPMSDKVMTTENSVYETKVTLPFIDEKDTEHQKEITTDEQITQTENTSDAKTTISYEILITEGTTITPIKEEKIDTDDQSITTSSSPPVYDVTSKATEADLLTKEITTLPPKELQSLNDNTKITETLPTDETELSTTYSEIQGHEMVTDRTEHTHQSFDISNTQPQITTESILSSVTEEKLVDTTIYSSFETIRTDKPVTEAKEPEVTDSKINEFTSTEATNISEKQDFGTTAFIKDDTGTTDRQSVTSTEHKESSTVATNLATKVSDENMTDDYSLTTPSPEDLNKPETDNTQSTNMLDHSESTISVTDNQTDFGEKDILPVTESTGSYSQSTQVTSTQEKGESKPEISTQSSIENENNESVTSKDSENMATDNIVTPLSEIPKTTEKYDDTNVLNESYSTVSSEYEKSETTPYFVEHTEHTHLLVDEFTTKSPEQETTVVNYDQKQPDRGDQNPDYINTDKDENQTSEPSKTTEYMHIDETVETTRTPLNTESSAITEREHTSTSPVSEIEKGTSSQHDEGDETSTLQQIIKEYTTELIEIQQTSSVSPLEVEETSKPSTSEISDEKITSEATKATTSKTVEESPTYLPPYTDKTSKPAEKPIDTNIPSSTQSADIHKPEVTDEPGEDISSPDMPPTGNGGYGTDEYIDEDQAFGPGTCRYGGKVYVSAQQIPRDDPCDFCFCFRSDIICLQQSCPPPIHGCHEEPIQGFCCPRYECPVSMATTLNVTTTTTTTTTTLPPHFLPHAYKGAAQRKGCQIKGHSYKVGEVVRASSGPCLHCTCGGDGQMKCDPKVCTPEPMLRQMIAAAVSAKRRR